MPSLPPRNVGIVDSPEGRQTCLGTLILRHFDTVSFDLGEQVLEEDWNGTTNTLEGKEVK